MTPTRLRQLRRRLSAALKCKRLLSQEKLGVMISTSGRTVRRWESGRSTIPDGVEQEILRLIEDAEA